MSYTKGDWTYFKSGANYLVSNEKGELLADVYAPEDSGLGTEEANAKLIVQAPAMLKLLSDACKVLIDIKIIDPKMFDGKLIQDIESLIKKQLYE